MVRGKWKPIETAPKDGRLVLVFNNDGNVYQAAWSTVLEKWIFASADQHGCGCCAGDGDSPTHWMPLPAPPEEVTDR